MSGAASAADPVREPVIVTSLADPETDLVAVDEQRSDSSAGDPMKSFAQALTEAAAAQREAIAARCKSVRDIPASGHGRDLWEANCRYQRR